MLLAQVRAIADGALSFAGPLGGVLAVGLVDGTPQAVQNMILAALVHSRVVDHVLPGTECVQRPQVCDNWWSTIGVSRARQGHQRPLTSSADYP
jgi:hypothetical protein